MENVIKGFYGRVFFEHAGEEMFVDIKFEAEILATPESIVSRIDSGVTAIKAAIDEQNVERRKGMH